MRDEFCRALVGRCDKPDMVFFTGDLGFMALEPLRKVMGCRFINAGVAEQNMMSVAAAMALEGWETWCYSIASFCFARPFEQIRNDICLHDLPVKVVGNGGGYSYGVMGPSHHAIDDYGALLCLPFIKVFVPCFGRDVEATVERAGICAHPCYIRLGREELPAGEQPPAYAPWRRLVTGDGPTVVSVGPGGGAAWRVLKELPTNLRPNLWVLSELPLASAPVPPELHDRLITDGRLLVIEEHIRQGGVGAMLALWAIEHGISIRRFHHLAAEGLALGVYGSQQFLRKHCGLHAENILDSVIAMEV